MEDPTLTPAVAGTGGLPAAPSGGRIKSSLTPSVAIENLAADKLILSATRIVFEEKEVPSLGGIPLLAKLGQGGMGAVYYGVHPRLHKEVAVKVLPFHLAQNQPEMVGRFFREAQMASSVYSPHLVGVTDVNEESGLFYLVMEYVSGMSAGAYLRDTRNLGKTGAAESIALDICIAAARGLAAAHAAGIVHRDVKPDNILIPKDKLSNELSFVSAKLADLGLACSEELSHSITGTQACMGTPGFMSPEQALDAKTCGKPTDIFSLGGTLYALLSGKAPFTASTLMKTLLATQNDAHAPIRSLRPEISEVTADLIDRCLAKDPAKRFPDGSALVAALKLCRASVQEPADTLIAIQEFARLQQAQEVGAPARTESTICGERPIAEAAVAQAQTSPAREPKSVPAPRPVLNGLRWAAAALLMGGAFGGLGAYLWHRSHAPVETNPTAVVSNEPQTVAPTQPAVIETPEPKVEPKISEAKPDVPAGPPPAKVEAVDSALLERTEKRHRKFEQIVADGQRDLKAAPQRALKEFEEAERLGAGDEAQKLPDLLGEVKPSLSARKTDARSAMTWAIESFRTGYAAARAAAEKKDWRGVQTRIEKALSDLADVESPLRDEAESLRAQARGKRDAFAQRLSDAEALLKAGEFAKARAAFEAVREIWPSSPEIEKVEQGIAAAQSGIKTLGYELAMRSGNENLKARNWKQAEIEFTRALQERPNDADGLKGLASVRDAIRDEEFQKAMTEANGVMANNGALPTDIKAALEILGKAKVCAQRALQLKPENIDALYLATVIDASTLVLNKSFDDAEKDVAKAKELKPDDPATQQVSNLLALARKNEAARVEAMKFKGVVEIQNEGTGMNVPYSIRWRLFDGSFTAWETKTVQSGKSFVHWCAGATRCQIQFNGSISGGTTLVSSDLEFHNISAAQEANGKVAKTHYIELNKNHTALELSHTKASSILKALGNGRY